MTNHTELKTHGRLHYKVLEKGKRRHYAWPPEAPDYTLFRKTDDDAQHAVRRSIDSFLNKTGCKTHKWTLIGPVAIGTTWYTEYEVNFIMAAQRRAYWFTYAVTRVLIELP